MEIDLAGVAKTTKYPLDAFLFVQRGLDFTVRRTHGDPQPQQEPAERHISGQILCAGLRDYAIAQYGLLARTVLRQWHIQGTEDFGHIVFAMIEAGLMQKTPEDSLRDFASVYDFNEAFTAELQFTGNG